MIVTCKMNQCGYYNRGFCAKKTAVCIDQLGMCEVHWRRGQRKTYIPGSFQKEQIVIEEGTGVRPVELTTQDAAHHEQSIEKSNDEKISQVQEGNEEANEKGG